MKQELIAKFVRYCEDNFDLKEQNLLPPYQSLSVCIIDCVYSLRTKYYKITVPVIERYASKFLESNKYKRGETLEQFLKNIELSGGCDKFATDILSNKQKLNDIPKSMVCSELARKLLLLNIHTKEDFENFKSVELLEIVIRSVKGIGDAALNYLFMLAGDSNRCKPDVHLKRCITNVCGYEMTNSECQKLMEESVKILNLKYPKLTVASLDNIIWKVYQAKTIKTVK